MCWLFHPPPQLTSHHGHVCVQYGQTAADRTCQSYSKPGKDAVRAQILALLADPTLVVWSRCRWIVLWRVIARREVMTAVFVEDDDE